MERQKTEWPDFRKPFRLAGCNPNKDKNVKCVLCKGPCAPRLCTLEQDGKHYRICQLCNTKLLTHGKKVNAKHVGKKPPPNPINHVQMVNCPTCGTPNPVSRANVYVRCEGCGRRLISVKVKKNLGRKR